MNNIKKASILDRWGCIKTLSNAFNDDPVINWFIRQDDKRDMALDLFFDTAFKNLTLPFGHVYTVAENNGVALWAPPGKWKFDIISQLKLIPDYTKVFKLFRLHRVMPYIQRIQNLHPEFPHYYLFAIGVAPEMQSRGLGSFMLKEVLKRCDNELIPAYLEATTPLNRDLYLRHGFKVTRKFSLSSGGPDMWFMLREPQKNLKTAV